MALFEITRTEQAEQDSWLRSIRTELNKNLHTKSSYYEFDFFQECPLAKNQRYEWENMYTKFNFECHEESTQHSLTSHNDNFFNSFDNQDQISDIPISDFHELHL